jgi:hypothetical protein
VTSPPSALSSSSGPALPPGGSSWRAGQRTAANASIAVNSALASSSFAQILSDAHAHVLDSSSGSDASTVGQGALGPVSSSAVKVEAQLTFAAPAGQNGLSSLINQSGNWSSGPVSSSGPGKPSSFPSKSADLKGSDASLPGGLSDLLGDVRAGHGESAAPHGSGDAEVPVARVVSIHSAHSSITPSASAKVPKQPAEITIDAQVTAPLTISLDQTSMNLVSTVPLNGVAPAEHLVSDRVVPNDDIVLRDSAANRVQAALSNPPAQLTAPAGSLAFALRLKSGSADGLTNRSASSSGEPDADSQVEEPARAMFAGAGSRLLDPIVNGSSNGLSYTSSEPSNSRASDGLPKGSSASSFAIQLNALTSGLSEQGRVTLAPGIGEPSGTSSESRGSASSESSNTGTNLGVVNLVLPKAGSGASTSMPRVSAADAFRADGLLESGQFPGAQSQTADGSARPSTTAGTAATAATVNLPENQISPTNEPVRNVRMQLSGEGNQRVDVRLVERGGALSVSVRSTDETLTRSLQDNLPELNSRLATQHLQTEIWVPARPASADFGGNGGSGTGAGSDSGTGSNGSGGSKQGGSSPDERSGYRSHSGQSQDGRRDRGPAWLRQLVALDGVPQ